MDDQNWMEKIGVVQSLGAINVSIEQLRGEIKSLRESKDTLHMEFRDKISHISMDLEGTGGNAGVKTIVDRHDQIIKTMAAILWLLCPTILGILGKITWDFLKAPR